MLRMPLKRFITEHFVSVVFTTLIMICLGVFGYTFSETMEMRSRVNALERWTATQEAKTEALKAALDRRTAEIERSMDKMSENIDVRLQDIRNMVQTLIDVLGNEPRRAGG